MLPDRIALIHGDTGRWGRLAARRLGAEGAFINLVDASYETVFTTAVELAELGIPHAFRVVSASDERAVAQLVQHLELNYGRVDILVNTTTVKFVPSLVELSPAGLRQTLDSEVMGNWLICQQVAQRMRHLGQGGRIITIIAPSQAGATASVTGGYSPVAGALVMLNQALAQELAPDRITVNVIVSRGLRMPQWQCRGDLETRAAGVPDLVSHLAREDSAQLSGLLITPA